MTDTEKRRIQLLKQTKMLYDDKRNTPPVHPRFQAVNQRLLEEQNMDLSKRGSFGVRLVIAALLFMLFVAMDYQDAETLSVDSTEIMQEIERDYIGQLIDRTSKGEL